MPPGSSNNLNDYLHTLFNTAFLILVTSLPAYKIAIMKDHTNVRAIHDETITSVKSNFFCEKFMYEKFDDRYLLQCDGDFLMIDDENNLTVAQKKKSATKFQLVPSLYGYEIKHRNLCLTVKSLDGAIKAVPCESNYKKSLLQHFDFKTLEGSSSEKNAWKAGEYPGEVENFKEALAKANMNNFFQDHLAFTDQVLESVKPIISSSYYQEKIKDLKEKEPDSDDQETLKFINDCNSIDNVDCDPDDPTIITFLGPDTNKDKKDDKKKKGKIKKK
ncbi:hypothetical protein EDEG_03855 [Edhazardia aedis USNM 41457]|uniref:Uncharacterized protein n=1 Tax=Edhazardia aedis (strain USNM 41457) TaxID=1003232 RepID=J9DJT0_EDHAE|nr:hypothetical protein EDEG_03855 [Edhazardia aedis USNM 41457]|eukprot:EJW01597.1 hypothetical protein EDEG_03855 [Edhazardia aedis USNM 41457]